MSTVNDGAAGSAASRSVSSGLAGLDAILGGLMLGDNVVWHVDHIDDYRAFARPYAAAALASGRRLVYIRFAAHPPILAPDAVSAVHVLDAQGGFESFTVRLHALIAAEGREAFYVFDCLSDLLDAWATDGMIGNCFRVTCPYLFTLDTVAYFALSRGAHSFATVDAIRATTQLLLDVYSVDGERYLHPLKVWQRSSPTMFLPHRHHDGRFSPLTVSSEITRLFAALPESAPGDAGRRLDFWERLFLRAADIVAGSAGDAERDAMVAQLCRILIGRDERILALARRHLGLADLLAIKRRLVGTGFVGGKAAGMLLAQAILRRDAAVPWRDALEAHDSFFIGSDLFHSFIVENGGWPLFTWQRSEKGYFAGAAELSALILRGTFPQEVLREFQKLLEHFGQCPIIVRSSSLLEDGFGNAFAGKYESVFCVNQGSPDARLEQFIEAVKRVYASTLNEDALHYRKQRNLAQQEERMALLVQRVSGAYHGDRFHPAFAGVAVSYNTFVWRHDIDPAAGMLRMVLGLGTRAVDRVEGDYPRIVALDQPLLRPQSDPADRRRYAQHDVDVLDIARNRLRTLAVEEIGDDAPTLPMRVLAEHDEGGWLVTFDRLLVETDLVHAMRSILRRLEDAYEYPVDIEFAGTFDTAGKLWINILQCRPLQTRGVQSKRVDIDDGDEPRALLRSRGQFMGGSIAQPIGRVVSVDPAAFMALSLSDKYDLARLVGRINRRVVASGDVPTLLIGPGRWGTSTPRLGVPVRFAEIDAMKAIAEVAFSAGGLHPELSFGSHFFQDLVETGIFYLAIDPDRPGCSFNAALLDALPNRLPDLLPDDARFASVLRLVDLDPPYRLLADIVSQKVACTPVRRPASKTP